MRAILTYHSIDESGSPISCPPDAFARHLRWLVSGRVRVTRIEELVALSDDTDAVAVTFDDGFLNFETEAAPLLLAHNLPATLFVVSARVGTTNSWDDGPHRRSPELPLLDWPALRRLQEKGVVLGAHSRTHRPLTGLSTVELDDEVRGSADEIEAQAGRRPTLFAYPYGSRDSASTQSVVASFAFGCTTEYQPVSESSQAPALPRLDMRYFTDARSLDGWGTQSFRARINVRYQLRKIGSAMRRV